MRDFKVELVPTSNIITTDYNPRFMDESEMEELSAEVDEFGLVENIVVNKRNMHCVGGNQRLEMARRKGWEKIPVVFVDLDDNEEIRLNLALNKIGGRWDTAKLADVFIKLAGETQNTGFTQEEIDKLLGSAKIEDLPAPDMEVTNQFVEFMFGSLQGTVRKETYEAFLQEVNRLADQHYPGHQEDFPLDPILEILAVPRPSES